MDTISDNTSGGKPMQAWATQAPAQGEPQPDALVARLRNKGDYERSLHIDRYAAADLIERQAREIAELREERKDWARRFMLDGRTPWEWENACKRAETSESAWKILCGGKQKIIDALETERAVWKDKAETRGREGCEARAKLAQAKRIIAAADAMRRGEDCPMCDSGKLRNQAKEHWDTCAFANYDAAREKVKP